MNAAKRQFPGLAATGGKNLYVVWLVVVRTGIIMLLARDIVKRLRRRGIL
jgi:hypothetical protein